MKHNTHMLAIKDIERLKREMIKIGADTAGISLMLPKGELLTIKVERVFLKAALILKQEMLARGGEAVVNRNVASLEQEISDILLIGTSGQYMQLIKKLKTQPFGLPLIANELTQVIECRRDGHRRRVIKCNGKELLIGNKTLVVGILNLTPDSFSDGGKFNCEEGAVRHALAMEASGADVIDIGGESTRPGHIPITVGEELRRIMPVVECLNKRLRIPISVDTSKSEVAEQVLAVGANMINDVWGLKNDPKMAAVIARHKVPVVIMHNRKVASYGSLISDIIADLRESVDIALAAGIEHDKIILDPGIGFAKSYQENLNVMYRLDEIVNLGYPVMLGSSRKSIIGYTLDLDKSQRLEGTIATVCQGISKGCKLVRVHDVLEVKRAVVMMDTMNDVEERE